MSTYRKYLAERLLQAPIIDRGSWQSTTAPSPVHELEDITLTMRVESSIAEWAARTEPDLPWAEDHFQERIGGFPCNPAPSYRTWPWHSELRQEMFKVDAAMGLEAKDEQPFDHTYPERMWPKYPGGVVRNEPMRGIRFDYGDLRDVVDLLQRDPFTRQAYLPIWFPEDTGSSVGQRVPCTLGYHFIRYGAQINMKYFMRSADITRHLHNDVYMAGRLLQWVVDQLRKDDYGAPYVGRLTLFISNLHMFTADTWLWKGTS